MSAWVVEDELSRTDVSTLRRRLGHMLRPWRGRIVVATMCLVGQTGASSPGPPWSPTGSTPGSAKETGR